jgi:diguanylate cyclase (GGDEF)-like protein
MASLPSFEHLHLEHLPDSALAHELTSGVSRLRFDREIESQYRAAHLKRVRLRVRLWFSIALGLSLLYSVVQALRTGLSSVNFGIEFFVVVPCAVLLAWVAWSSEYQRLFLPVTRVLVPLKGALVAFFIAPLIGSGHDEELATLTVYVIAAFFFSGMMFRTAAVSALAIVASFAATSIALGIVTDVFLKSMLVLTVTAAMGASAYLDVERSARRSFLEDALIADMVERDGLTGLMNRRALDAYLLRVWQQAQRDHRTLAVLMIDIDHFKAYNDTYGHQAGDAALRTVAQLLMTFTRRPLDIAARYGGEEFIVVLYDMQAAYVQDVAERIRYSVECMAVPKTAPVNVPGVTVSVGAGVVEPVIGRTPQGAVQFADEALYEAKRSGRNCVHFSSLEDYRKVSTGPFRTLERTAQ